MCCCVIQYLYENVTLQHQSSQHQRLTQGFGAPSRAGIVYDKPQIKPATRMVFNKEGKCPVMTLWQDAFGSIRLRG